MLTTEKIIILDFGSQYTQLIARKVRECGVYAEIYPYNITEEKLAELNPKGVILSGGPSSVYAEGAPHPSFDVFNTGVPVLGICYGLQLMAYKLGGTVDKAARREYGRAELSVDDDDDLFEGVPKINTVWMSHGDHLTAAPKGFVTIGHSGNTDFCAIRSEDRKLFGIQFHPEVHHTDEGNKILNNFVRKICGCTQTWSTHSFIETQINKIRETVQDDEVICALSGGVDSTVLAVLLHKAIGDKLKCIHIDTGLMRLDESKKLMQLFAENFNMNIELIAGNETFLGRLQGISDPEQKRKIIGKSFIDLFDVAAKAHNNAKWLAQGYRSKVRRLLLNRITMWAGCPRKWD